MPSLTPFAVAATARSSSLRLRIAILAVLAMVVVSERHAAAHGAPPPSLKGVRPPEVVGLASGPDRVVRNARRAIALGKALFWDIQVGSDGVACATCHHHAGADGRVVNQLSPGRRPDARPSAGTFEATGGGQAGSANLTLMRGDFPLHRLADPSDMTSAVVFTTDDVVGSSGSFGGDFLGTVDGSANDDCARSSDAIFHVGSLGTRRATSRNAPSVINAALARRLFWDGRANNRFNGSSPYGDRDADAGVWVYDRGVVGFTRFAFDDSALASQAVAPPLDATEMSCSGRTFADIARKLLARRPLQFQQVSASDGVLGRYALRNSTGLKSTYAKMVRAAFARRYWAAAAGSFGSPVAGDAPYSQMEANFAMFFALAIQMYEGTLISDDSPYDGARDAQGYPIAFDDQQKRGLTAFLNFHCSDCHGGATLSGGGSSVSLPLTDVDRKPIRASNGALILGLADAGFVDTSVTPPDHDRGLGEDDPFGQPLSFAAGFRALLTGAAPGPVDRMQTKACAMTSPFSTSSYGQDAFAAGDLVPDPSGHSGCVDPLRALVPSAAVAAAEMSLPSNGRLIDGNDGAFKVPPLRNVELTGPYMHNGGMASLEEVVEFYNRGGNFASAGKDAEFLFSFGMDAATRADLVVFLKTLTDERVRWEKAPFDHPSLPLPNGHPTTMSGLVASTTAGFEGLAETAIAQIPAVGAAGRSEAMGPLHPFADALQP